MERSVTGPVFLQAAEDLLRKVDGASDPTATLLAAEARTLVDLFRAWASVRPETDARAEALNRLIELNRRVLIYISKKTRG